MPSNPGDGMPSRRATIEAWFRHIRDGDPDGEAAAEEVCSWTFFLPAEQQWQLVVEMIHLAPDDSCLGEVAAGPLEGLLGRFGEQFIARVEERAAQDHKFARTLTGVWQHRMTDKVYGRIQALKAAVSDPLQSE
jgi:hypothetical protein